MLDLPLDSYASTSAVTLEALAALAMHVASDETRVVFGVGAGISTAAGIPDFRGGQASLYGAGAGSGGRYPTPDHSTQPDARRDQPQRAARVKELSHYDAILRLDSRAEHFKLMANLRRAAKRAPKRQKEADGLRPTSTGRSSSPAPTAFHGLMQELSSRGRLARVYSQNIDGLEASVGLRSGVDERSAEEAASPTPLRRRKRRRLSQASDDSSSDFDRPDWSPRRGQSRTVPDRNDLQVVALHGSLDRVLCSVCQWTSAWRKRHTKAFKDGRAPPCPNCRGRARSRILRSKRAIDPSPLAFLRPAIALYNDPSFASSAAASEISTMVAADLADGPLCLVVAGTSLRIPGFRSLVKDFAKEVKRNGGLAVLVNRDPVGKEWSAFFDYHFLGDTEVFADHLRDLLDAFLPAAADADSQNPPRPSHDCQSTVDTPTSYRPISELSLPPTPPPSSSPSADSRYLQTRPAVPERASPTAKIFKNDPLAPTDPVEPAKFPFPAAGVAEGPPRTAERAYLSPPPSSLPRDESDQPPHAEAVATIEKVPGAPDPKSEDPDRRKTARTVQEPVPMSVAEVLRRAEKQARKRRRAEREQARLEIM